MPFQTIPPLYQVWMSMKDRCRNPRAKQFADYGGRGIRVCERWRISYADFAADMGPRPEGFQLDRIDNDGNYEPGNCRWVDRKTQQRNRRVTKRVTVEGVCYIAIELAERAGVKVDTIVERAERGLTLAEVLSPFRQGPPPVISAEAVAKSAALKRAKTHCPHGHTYADAIVSKEGFRRCRTCWNAKEKARLDAKRSLA